MLIGFSILTLLGLAGSGAVIAVVYVVLVMRPQRPAPAAPRRSAPAHLTVQMLVEQLVAVGDEDSMFLDRGSGRFVTLADDLLAVLEGDDELEESYDASKTQMEQVRRKLRSKALLPLPTKAETKEFLLRERFCEGLPEGEVKEQMLKVQSGRTGFRSFDGAVQRLGLAEQWHRFRDAAFSRIALAWLERHEIHFEANGPVAGRTDQELRQAS